MSKRRILFQNWIVELGRDPDIPLDLGHDGKQELLPLYYENQTAVESSGGDESENRRLEYIRRKVQEALSKLDDDEQEFIERFYYMGESYKAMSEQSGRPIHKLEALHRRAVQRLKKGLRKTVLELYGITDDRTVPECILCTSSYCSEIDLIISQRNPSRTWRPVIREIKKLFNIEIRSPQLLIGHEKYHWQAVENIKENIKKDEDKRKRE